MILREVAFLLIYTSALIIVCMATWQMCIWFPICIINQLLLNTNSLSAGYLALSVERVPYSWGHTSTIAGESRRVEQGASLRAAWLGSNKQCYGKFG